MQNLLRSNKRKIDSSSSPTLIRAKKLATSPENRLRGPTVPSPRRTSRRFKRLFSPAVSKSKRRKVTIIQPPDDDLSLNFSQLSPDTSKNEPGITPSKIHRKVVKRRVYKLQGRKSTEKLKSSASRNRGFKFDPSLKIKTSFGSPASKKVNATSPDTRRFTSSMGCDDDDDSFKNMALNLRCINRQKGALRPVVIDGSNVAMAHGSNAYFSPMGLDIAINHFLRRGHPEVIAFLPLFRKSRCGKSDQEMLNDWHLKGNLSFTPNGCYDDRIILQYAAANGAIVISNDRFRDLKGEGTEIRRVINNRVLRFNWVNDSLIFPDDPHGRNGPDISALCRF